MPVNHNQYIATLQVAASGRTHQTVYSGAVEVCGMGSDASTVAPMVHPAILEKEPIEPSGIPSASAKSSFGGTASEMTQQHNKI